MEIVPPTPRVSPPALRSKYNHHHQMGYNDTYFCDYCSFFNNVLNSMAPSNFVCALLQTSSLHDMCVLPTTLSSQHPNIRQSLSGRP